MKAGDILDGRYQITERLGAGGMGEVYKATHTFLGSSRVIKVVHPHISSSEDARDRFLREARAATKVQHQNVATLHDFASLPDGSHYMVWEYIEGQNLAQRLREKGTLPPRQAVAIAADALRGLDAIHRAGIIHRDISPENLMITAGDEVKIIDLGVAKVEDSDAVSQTRTGIFVGKLRYASPEQLGFLPEGEKVDSRADIYAMAMVLVELLTGRPPYEAKSPHEYFLLHAREAPTQQVRLPAGMPGSAVLQAILEKALARDRTQRYRTASEFADALEKVEQSLPHAQDTATLATPLEGDTTMSVPPAITAPDTLHRETLTSSSRSGQTVRAGVASSPSTAAAAPAGAPLPSAETTVRTPLPPLAPKMRKGINPLFLLLFVGLAVLAVAAVLLVPRFRERQPAVEQATATAPPPVVSARVPPISETSLTVTSDATAATTTTTLPTTPTTTITEVATTTSVPATDSVPPLPAPAPARPAPASTATPARRPAPRSVAKPEPARQAEPEEGTGEESAPARISNVPTYVDGGPDEDGNERALERLRSELRGTRTVAVRAGAMTLDVTRALRDELPEIQFAGEADVVLRFEGSLERLGRGRKRRSATGTVSKNGRVIFRYELPNEVYRVGMSPPDAFVRVIAEAMSP